MGLVPHGRFAEFQEKQIAGPSLYTNLRWSPDGYSLAFTKGTNFDLVVYSLQDGKEHALNQTTTRFEWTPSNRISFRKHRGDLSGNPIPEVADLYAINPDATHHEVIAEHLNNPGDFVWFQDSKQVAIVMTNPEDMSNGNRDVYLLNLSDHRAIKLLSPQDLKLDDISILALSPDNTQLLLKGVRGDSFPKSLLCVYDLVERRVVRELDLDEFFREDSVDPYHKAGFGTDHLQMVEVGGAHWIVGDFYASRGECYNYAVYFFNLDEPAENFCIPAKGVVAEIVAAPDLSKIAYLAVDGPGYSYIMMADLPVKYQERLKNR